MKYLKNVLIILIFIFLFWQTAKFFNYILVDDTKQYTRIMMHELYNEKDNIDTIFVGSSHVYRGIDSNITDELLHENTFNLGTSSQDMLASFTLIKETLKTNDVKHIYLDVYYEIALMEPYKEREVLTDVYIISDYMKPSLNKYEFLAQASDSKYYINSLLPARRYSKKLLDFDYIKKVIDSKNNENYKNYVWDKNIYENEQYIKKGYVESFDELDEFYYNVPSWNIDIDKINSDWIKNLNNIIKLCNDKDIELTFLMLPMPEVTIMSLDNYDDYYSYIKNIADKNNLKYWDFNLINNEYFDTLDNSLFQDEHHLNGKGARLFSKLFSELVNSNKESDMFYNSFKEKKEVDIAKVYGISKVKNSDSLDYKIISNSETLEYKILLGDNLIRDYSKDKVFNMNISEEDIKKIVIKVKE